MSEKREIPIGKSNIKYDSWKLIEICSKSYDEEYNKK